MTDKSWRCPYCEQVVTFPHENRTGDVHFFANNRNSGLGLRTWITICPNLACGEYTIDAALYRSNDQYPLAIIGSPLFSWQLKPNSSARTYPTYIPLAIRQDYEEACLIRNLSPKAAATLARRCLRGIIRDFWRIVKPSLKDEVDALRRVIDPRTWHTIDAVCSIGNIGAHMEMDTNLISDVEHGEADLLIGLLETLIRDSYIKTHDRNAHLQKLIAAAAARKNTPAPALPRIR